MQEINFFKTNCEFETTKVNEFGIHDELHNDIPAYLVFDAEKASMLRVLNSTGKSINFYPIDNCVKIHKENSKDKESICDGMLIYDNNITFVELAESHHKSVEDCIGQIKSTIFQFQKYHPNLVFVKKYAIVSNLARPTSTISHEKCENFREESGFGLSVKTVLKIK
ncbi:hypothetical protein FVB9288_02042 [Flavobacterium sp. CECT 9288]|uniref:hypothetical protein n=1 Tax=Flavobacterium sp. CECT 9288 TaxID=2845819 RepID=UPI001E476591|nr:hypothetical protein [Flavobacterium sp. CECT 9288]CAH0336351.1 hypothetical protein FVB9288_02042 [Flavobacterium sp. CECT 9288]